jgi:hypothetical protein
VLNGEELAAAEPTTARARRSARATARLPRETVLFIPALYGG